MTKNPVASKEVLPLLQAAKKYFFRHGSLVDDFGTSELNAKFLYKKITNNLNGLEDVSVELCAATVFDAPPSYITVTATFFYSHAAAASIRMLENRRSPYDDPGYVSWR